MGLAMLVLLSIGTAQSTLEPVIHSEITEHFRCLSTGFPHTFGHFDRFQYQYDVWSWHYVFSLLDPFPHNRRGHSGSRRPSPAPLSAASR